MPPRREHPRLLSVRARLACCVVAGEVGGAIERARRRVEEERRIDTVPERCTKQVVIIHPMQRHRGSVADERSERGCLDTLPTGGGSELLIFPKLRHCRHVAIAGERANACE